ncbi:hypothetical protein [Chamaesiphon polymorphus]|uniref:Uncharacterized protein n=1 Tax=Chamaesiphon polymorphus CCALA 037 TaxID=2107692 RepID=A0A2T1GC19_9CYAN|nr:hypothetical protein [Chamaesiphon polymorphus]PSB54909.1 hypothetical protein C7B77_16725 [Chamaesiphon polymorphus CCALA 037]
MKRFALVGLSILCLSLAATTSVKAETRTERIAMSAQTSTATTIDNTQTAPSALPGRAGTRTERISMTTATIGSNPANTKLTPFGLVSLAYQGEYRMQGIPGFGSFQSATHSKTITAKDLVKAAIATNQLSPETQTDRDYLNAVNSQLSFSRN